MNTVERDKKEAALTRKLQLMAGNITAIAAKVLEAGLARMEVDEQGKVLPGIKNMNINEEIKKEIAEKTEIYWQVMRDYIDDYQAAEIWAAVNEQLARL